jgi:transposase-like protein
VERPGQRVEETSPAEFTPPHCPRRDCPAHRPGGDVRFRWSKAGGYRRNVRRTRIPRFRCLVCRRTFSQQTFACSYFLKRPELLLPVAAGLVAGSAHRQLARSLGCAPSTVTRLASRLGRHGLLLQRLLLAELRERREVVVLDDFETFVGAQFYQLAVPTAVGGESAFVYGLDHALHLRGGRLNPYQRGRRSALFRRSGRPAPGERSRAVQRVLQALLAQTPTLHLVSDGNPLYDQALARLQGRARITHRRFPNPRRGPKGAPRSPAARERDRHLSAVDQLHRLVRHSQAHHRRETLAFGRSVNGVVERFFLLAVWRNLVKTCSERRPRRGTPATRLGLTVGRWSWAQVFARRLFLDHAPLSPDEKRIYHRGLLTPTLGPQRPHDPVYAL